MKIRVLNAGDGHKVLVVKTYVNRGFHTVGAKVDITALNQAALRENLRPAIKKVTEATGNFLNGADEPGGGE